MAHVLKNAMNCKNWLKTTNVRSSLTWEVGGSGGSEGTDGTEGTDSTEGSGGSGGSEGLSVALYLNYSRLRRIGYNKCYVPKWSIKVIPCLTDLDLIWGVLYL